MLSVEKYGQNINLENLTSKNNIKEIILDNLKSGKVINIDMNIGTKFVSEITNDGNDLTLTFTQGNDNYKVILKGMIEILGTNNGTDLIKISEVDNSGILKGKVFSIYDLASATEASAAGGEVVSQADGIDVSPENTDLTYDDTPDIAERIVVDNPITQNGYQPLFINLASNDQTNESEVIVAYSGKLIDGYISGATVFIDANNDDIFDDGEFYTITDEDGDFNFTEKLYQKGTDTDSDGNDDLLDINDYTDSYNSAKSQGQLIAFGGTDISTGLTFEGYYTAPAGSTTVSPLTTLINELAGVNATAEGIAAAEDALASAFGLDTDIDLLNYDPVAEVNIAVQSVAIQIANVVNQTAALIDGGTAGDSEASASLATFNSIAQLISDSNSTGITVDLSNSSTISTIIQTTAIANNVTVTSQELEVISTSMASVNTQVQEADSFEAIAQIQEDSESLENDIEQMLENSAPEITNLQTIVSVEESELSDITVAEEDYDNFIYSNTLSAATDANSDELTYLYANNLVLSVSTSSVEMINMLNSEDDAVALNLLKISLNDFLSNIEPFLTTELSATLTSFSQAVDNATSTQEIKALLVSPFSLTATTISVTLPVSEEKAETLAEDGLLNITVNESGSYTVSSPMFNSMADYESTTISFNYVVSDGIENSEEATVTLTVEGSNDVPTVTIESTLPTVSESILENGYYFVLSQVDVLNSLNIEDADLTNYHTLILDSDVSFNGTLVSSTQDAGIFQLSQAFIDTYGIEANEDDFLIFNDAFEGLSQDEIMAISFNVVVNDGSDLSDSVTISFDFSGTNEAPEITNLQTIVSVEESELSDITVAGEEYDNFIYSNTLSAATDANSDELSYLYANNLVLSVSTSSVEMINMLNSEDDAVALNLLKISLNDFLSNIEPFLTTELSATLTSFSQAVDNATSTQEIKALLVSPFSLTATTISVTLPVSEEKAETLAEDGLLNITVDASGSYTVSSPMFNSMADYESTTISFDYHGYNDSFRDVKTVSLTVEGSNDTPIVTNTIQTFGVNETPTDIHVNTTTSLNQDDSVTASLSSGGFVVIWISEESSYYGPTDIYGQIFNADGTKLGEEFLVNQVTEDSQSLPSVSGLENGGFVVTWSSYDADTNDDIVAKIFDSTGIVVVEDFIVNTYTTSSQHDPSVTTLSNGNFVITWDSYGQLEDDDTPVDELHEVFAQIFTADGNAVGSEFLVNTYLTDEQISPEITALSDGKFVITWESIGQDSSYYGVYAQIFNADGSKSGDEFLVNDTTYINQLDPSISALSDGGFVITWTSTYSQDGSGDGVYAKIFNSDGTTIDEFLVNTETYSNQNDSSVTGLSNGNFVVTWDSSYQDGSSSGVYGQIFDSTGIRVGGEFLINTTTANSQIEPSITALNDGGFVVTWTSAFQNDSSNGIFAQIFNADGTVRSVITQTGVELPTISENALEYGFYYVLSQEDILASLNIEDADLTNYHTLIVNSNVSFDGISADSMEAAGIIQLSQSFIDDNGIEANEDDFLIFNDAFEGLSREDSMSISFEVIVNDGSDLSDPVTISFDIEGSDFYISNHNLAIESDGGEYNLSEILAAASQAEVGYLDSVDLSYSGEHILSNLSLDEFVLLTDESNTLIINKDNDDYVEIDIEVWKTNINDQTYTDENNIVYDKYTALYNSTNNLNETTTLTLLIEKDETISL